MTTNDEVRSSVKRTDNAGTTMDAADPKNSSGGVFSKPRHTSLKLADAAMNPKNDPCDLCEDALPGYVLDDLVAADRTWVVEHTKTCSYCRNELDSFEALDDLLDMCGAEVEASATPGARASWGIFDSPIGPLSVAVSDKGVCEIGFTWVEDDRTFAARLIDRGFVPVKDQSALLPVVHELNDYFSGSRDHFDLLVDLGGLTDFSRSVLNATASVPFGETRTYADIARAIGKPGATRAVGNALNKNPIPLIVPCHRIVPTGGGIGNYAGTPQVKERLLVLEGALNGGVLRQGFA